MPYIYIGRKTDFKGKTLWEIIGNLKNFGINRIVGRNMFQRYPEPSYIKVVKVEALPNVKNISYDEKRKVIAMVERTFRGMKYPKYIQMESSTYKSDYFLIPKYQEGTFCKAVQASQTKILANKMEFPPLLKEYIMHQMESNVTSSPEEPKMKICYNLHGYQIYRVAEEGEIPTVPEPSIGLGKPVTPKLYETITKI